MVLYRGDDRVLRLPAFRNEKSPGRDAGDAGGFVAQTAAIGMRWKESYDELRPGGGHIPLSNMYESMVFWSWSIILIFLIFERVYRNRSLGVIAAPLGFLTIASISIAPNISQEIEPLVPALQSNWLTVHVITSFPATPRSRSLRGQRALPDPLAPRSARTASYVVGMASLVTMLTLFAATISISVQKVGGAAAAPVRGLVPEHRRGSRSSPGSPRSGSSRCSGTWARCTTSASPRCSPACGFSTI
jgi:hypothetical protein